MVKRSLKTAFFLSAGITIGGVIIPRIFVFPHLYNETYPPILLHSIIYFASSYIICFVFFLLIDWIKSKFTRN